MGQIYASGQKPKIFVGDRKVKKIYAGAEQVYSSGCLVTYHVDLNTTYVEEIEDGQYISKPKTFTPSKTGYTFYGWRYDSIATDAVWGIPPGNDPIVGKEITSDTYEVYAVFVATASITYKANGGSGSDVVDRLPHYYNNGNEAWAVFTIRTNPFTRSGYTFLNWVMNNGRPGPVIGSTISTKEDIILLANWKVSRLVVYETTGEGGGSTATIHNTSYVTFGGSWGASSGRVSAYVSGTGNSTNQTVNGSFNLNLGGYRKATIVLKFYSDNAHENARVARGSISGICGNASADSAGNWDDITGTRVVTVSGAVNGSAYASKDYNNNWYTYCGSGIIIRSITVEM